VRAAPARAAGAQWSPGLEAEGWDRRRALLDGEAAAIMAIGPVSLRRNRATGIPRRTARHWNAIARLVVPLDAVRAALHHDDDPKFRRAGAQAAAVVLQHCADAGQPYWAWSSWDWARLAGSGSGEFVAARSLPTERTVRPFLVALAYLLGGFTDFQHLGMFNRLHLAQLVFGSEAVDAAMTEAAAVLDRWGYRSQARDAGHQLPGVLAQALLINSSPRLQDLSTEAFGRLRGHPAAAGRRHQTTLFALQKAAAHLGYCQPPVRPGRNQMPVIEGADPAWAQWVERWHATSALTPRVRAIIRTIMAKAGRWLAAEHPEITGPGQWTRQTCAEWVAAVDRMTVGDYVQRTDALGGRAGKPVSPRTKAHQLMATRVFFRDCQEWEWIPRRFDPVRALAVPRSVSALIGTDPRVIADDVWAKLLHAGLNIEAGDLPGTSAGSYYPVELIRALTLTWLFSGLRSDEITRLRTGCIRWQHDGRPSRATPARSSPARPSACSTFPSTRPAPHSPSPSTRSSARPSRHGRRCGLPSPRGPTARPASRPTCCSPSARTPSPGPTSTAPSSRRYARRPASRPPTSAATSPATGHAPRSPASSTTPRSR
jgi:hypothetical protein